MYQYGNTYWTKLKAKQYGPIFLKRFKNYIKRRNLDSKLVDLLHRNSSKFGDNFGLKSEKGQITLNFAR